MRGPRSGTYYRRYAGRLLDIFPFQILFYSVSNQLHVMSLPSTVRTFPFHQSRLSIPEIPVSGGHHYNWHAQTRVYSCAWHSFRRNECRWANAAVELCRLSSVWNAGGQLKYASYTVNPSDLSQERTLFNVAGTSIFVVTLVRAVEYYISFISSIHRYILELN